MMFGKPIDLKKLWVYPLSRRQSLVKISDVLVDPAAPPPPCPPPVLAATQDCARAIEAARSAGASVLVFFGAHLVKNGGAALVTSLMDQRWVTHLATNGAGAIHDWEFAYQGISTENVQQNVARGTFGLWNETGRNLHLALLAGALDNLGFGASVGRFIQEDGIHLPAVEELKQSVQSHPADPLAPAWAELAQVMLEHQIHGGQHTVKHPEKHNSIFGQAYRHQLPITVHPGIGYDIIANHPMFNGAVIGRAGGLDFRLLGGAVNGLDGGVVLSLGSAIMAPQVFEKSLSCVNNLRLQESRAIVQNHTIYVVDLQEGQWNWSEGEPPKDHPAYYLRFCKSFSRMGGQMHYVQSDHLVFLHNLLRELSALSEGNE